MNKEAERELGYLAVNLVADVANHASADGNHREEGQVHRRYLQERSHHEEEAEDYQRRRTAVGLDQVADVPEEVVLQDERQLFP